MPLSVLQRRYRGPRGGATFTARRPPSVWGQATFFAHRPVPLEGHATFRASRPTPAPQAGSPLLEYTLEVSGLPGEVLRAEYRHSGQYEELTATVSGLWPLEMPSVLVHLKAEAGGVLLGELPQRLFDGLAQEPELDTAEATTTFTFRNSVDHLLRGIRLAELIPWKLAPTPDPCLRVRQRVNISQLVTQALRDHVDFFFVLEDDPLVSSSWVEGRVDFSTLNITPQALWDATYGALGMVLHVQPRGQGLQLVGRWPQPTEEVTGGARIDADWRLTELPQRQWWQTPKRLTVRGADHVTELTPELLLEWVGADDPAYREVQLAVHPNSEWYTPPESNGTSLVQRGFLKLNGQLVRQVEFVTGDVFVTETIEGKVKGRLFRNVGTGYKHTRTVYDPDCPARPILQEVEAVTWAYTYTTQLEQFEVFGPGIITYLSVGEAVEQQTTTTTYLYSPQGQLIAETTGGRKLMSLQQENADADPQDRGPLESREVVIQPVTQSWEDLGGGRFRHTPGTGGQTLLPVYDKETGEAVRTIAVARSTPDAPRITDQAPPSYDYKPYCGVIRDVLDPTGLVLHAGDAGLGEEREVNVPFLDPAALERVGRTILSSQWNRLVTTFSVPFPLGYLPGTWLEDGRVQELTITLEEGEVTSTVACTRLDTTLLPPGAAGVEPWRADPNSGRAILLTRRPGGARARLVTGWDPAAKMPLVEDAFIAFRTGFPPGYGDELDWQLIRGRREATNAR